MPRYAGTSGKRLDAPRWPNSAALRIRGQPSGDERNACSERLAQSSMEETARVSDTQRIAQPYGVARLVLRGA